MCGFAALVTPGRTFEPELLAAMDRDLFHRGPDSGDTSSEEGIALVFRRLSIMDPNARADQPMTTRDGRYTLVFNGEIYNFREIRRKLEQKGVSFETSGDSEAVLQGFIHYGEDIFDQLEGMFALALIDRHKKRLVVARDPFGIKPLYMLRQGELVAFASEMRPLYRLRRPEPDVSAVSELLTFGWAAGRTSNVKGIDRIPGGTVVSVDLQSGAVTERRFLDPLQLLQAADRAELSERELDEICEEALLQSVKAHLMSDVGYAAQLSGGVDSSLVVAMSQQFADSPLRTFGIALGDWKYDETSYRDLVVDSYGLQHDELQVTGADFADALPRAISHMEGPVPHGGCVLLMLLCDRIARHTKVCLVGEGADEMFGGYFRYETWRKDVVKDRIARTFPQMAKLLPNIWPFAGVRRMAGYDAAVYASVYSDFARLHSLFPDLVPGPGLRETVSRAFADFRDRLFAIDQSTYLESLLVRQDKMSMAASVESRVPFVHVPLARLLNSLPRDYRVPGGITKPILKRVSEKYLPKELIHRRKVGLRLPYNDWLKNESDLGRFLDTLTDTSCRLWDFGDRQKVRQLVADFREGRLPEKVSVHRIVFVELWLRSLGSPEGVRSWT